jgi:HSP20 family molecular chaperone IbpA
MEYLEEIKTTTKLKNFSSERPSWNIKTSCLHALSNVSITSREIIVTTDMPNIDLETINIKIVDELTLEIMAKLKKKVSFTDLGIYHRRGEFSFLRCQNLLQVAVDLEKMKISYEEGIIEVRIPRKDVT